MNAAADAAEALAALTPSAEVLAFAALMFLAGAVCPTYYAQERLRGFGRLLASRLPYEPPPGMSEEEALTEAAESVEEE